MIVKMIKDLGRRMYAQNEKLEIFNNELENMQNNKIEMNTITEMKNTLEEINSGLNDSEEQTDGLEDNVVQITTTEQKEEWKEMKTI